MREGREEREDVYVSEARAWCCEETFLCQIGAEWCICFYCVCIECALFHESRIVPAIN